MATRKQMGISDIKGDGKELFFIIHFIIIFSAAKFGIIFDFCHVVYLFYIDLFVFLLSN